MTGRIAVFDVNETTLDLRPVRDTVDRLLGPQGGFQAWFQRLLQISMTTTATGSYSDFTTLAESAFRAVAETGGSHVDATGWPDVAAAMGRLEPHPDVSDGLGRLQSEGWSLIALTNSAQRSVDAQLQQAGLTPLFDHVLSVDRVGAYKPSAEPYLLAAEVADVEPGDLWMVACHDWDLAGARSVGMSTAFVRRSGMSYASMFAAPELDVEDFVELADALIALG